MCAVSIFMWYYVIVDHFRGTITKVSNCTQDSVVSLGRKKKTGSCFGKF